MLHRFHLLTSDLSMFGGGAGEGAAPAGPADAPAADAPAAEAPAPEQAQDAAAPASDDKAKAFRALVRGEFREQYAAATRKLINRRFRETDARIRAMQPVIDTLDARYGTGGDMDKLLRAIEGDAAYWRAAADAAGMSVEQYRAVCAREQRERQLLDTQRAQQTQYMAMLRCDQWRAEAEALKGKYPQFDLETMLDDDLFTLMLRNNYPMEQAYKACNPDRLAAEAAANAEKAVTDNIRARGGRPAEAGANPSSAFAVKDDVSKLSDRDVLRILGQISSGGRVSFG